MWAKVVQVVKCTHVVVVVVVAVSTAAPVVIVQIAFKYESMRENVCVEF